MGSTLDQIERVARKELLLTIPEPTRGKIILIGVIACISAPFLTIIFMFVPVLGQLLTLLNIGLGLRYLWILHSRKAACAALIGAGTSLSAFIIASGQLRAKIEIVLYSMLALGTGFELLLLLIITGGLWRLYNPALRPKG